MSLGEGGVWEEWDDPSSRRVWGEDTGKSEAEGSAWINFLPIPYQAEREKKALRNRILFTMLDNKARSMISHTTAK